MVANALGFYNSKMTQRFATDVLIIGGGAAGLSAALNLAPRARVTLLCKGSAEASASQWAQGGVAAVTAPDDSLEAHAEDTMDAGAGLCDPDIVQFTVAGAERAISRLRSRGLAFDSIGDEPDLTREGGHSFRRILHVADATGSALVETLTQRVLDHPNIELFHDRIAIDLINLSKLGRQGNRCAGAYVLNRSSGRVEVFQARFVVLATGGAAKAYLYTSNPDSATGDGIAMAWRAGCRVANMEFIQFHPTCLYHPYAKSFLISEAVRGEGGVLTLADGARFMPKFDPRAELAPRDIVARAIDHEMKRLGQDNVYLDISHRPRRFIEERFPNIMRRCREFGFDLAGGPVPVVPAAHYTCGGVVVAQSGATDIPGLYAIGEVSCTGLHGANRLASNSLLECLVFADAAADAIAAQLDAPYAPVEAPHWDESQVKDSDEDVVIAHNWEELRRFMWDYVGIVRTNKRLQRALHRAQLLKQEVHEYYSHYRVSNDLIELRNLIDVADLIIRCALLRRESRGLHFNLDYPQTAAEAKDTILFPGTLEHLDLMRPYLNLSAGQ